MSTTLKEDGDYGVSPTPSKADFQFAPHPSSMTSASQNNPESGGFRFWGFVLSSKLGFKFLSYVSSLDNQLMKWLFSCNSPILK